MYIFGRREADLFRFTVKHSFIMLAIICSIVLAQAYVVEWVIPTYQIINNKAAALAVDPSKGYVYLLILLAIFINGKRRTNIEVDKI